MLLRDGAKEWDDVSVLLSRPRVAKVSRRVENETKLLRLRQCQSARREARPGEMM